jgi:hypothetical protein
MLFLFPVLPAFAALAVSIGEAAGIGAGVFGVGAALKGAADYNRAASLRKTANEAYQNMALRLKQKARSLQNRFTAFGTLKLQTYTGVIRKAAAVLSRFKTVDLSSFTDMRVEHIAFLKNDAAPPETSCVKASDVLSCLSIGVHAAVNDRIPYRDTPPLRKFIGAFGMNGFPGNGLPRIPCAAAALAGLSWGISGNAAKSAAESDAAALSRETEKMQSVLAGFEMMAGRIDEGEALITALAGKLKQVLQTLGKSEKEAVQPSVAANLETAISLTRALKQVIETDVCTGNGMINAQSGVVFHKISKEYGGAGHV